MLKQNIAQERFGSKIRSRTRPLFYSGFAMKLFDKIYTRKMLDHHQTYNQVLTQEEGASVVYLDYKRHQGSVYPYTDQV